MPDWFVLENVDMDSTGTDGGTSSGENDSNFALIVQALSDIGYIVRAYHLSAQDYGLPQRRVRLYFIGYKESTQGHVNFARLEKNLQKCRLKCQPPAACQ
eukprot:s8751_g3.t1